MRHQRWGSELSALLALPSLITAVTFDCNHLRVDGQSFDLSALKGPHAVHYIEDTPPSLSNTTFTLDICNPLQRTKDVPKADECPGGTRVCGIETDYNSADGTSSIKKVVPIAGEYTSSNGRSMDPTLERLKNSASHGDSEREGVRVVSNGGKYPFDKSSGTPQKAIIEFVCDPDRTGLEHVEGDSREKVDDAAEERMKRRADDDKKEDGDKGGDKGDDKDKEEEDDASLKFISYKTEGEADREAGVSRSEWRTKYACEGQTEHEPSKGKSNHWGFFTWFLIISFLGVAAYSIFGSWLNYNRYGARGWDLVPHGDTIRDLPYLMKDWGRSIVGTVQGHGTRGGYSAV